MMSLSAKPAHSTSVDIRVLPTMTVRVLRLKIAKTLKAHVKGSLTKTEYRLWALLRRGAGQDSWVCRELNDEQAEVDFLGLEDGSCVAACIL